MKHASSTRRTFFALTPLKARRLRHALTMAEVAVAAGMSLTKVSYLERDEAAGTAEERKRVRVAIDCLVARVERAQVSG